MDAQGGDVVGGSLLQVGEADALVAPGLRGSTSEAERGRERPREVAHCLEASTGFKGSFLGGYLEERGFLGRSGCEAELQFAEHVIEQEDQLSGSQQHLLLPLHSARGESFTGIEY